MRKEIYTQVKSFAEFAVRFFGIPLAIGVLLGWEFSGIQVFWAIMVLAGMGVWIAAEIIIQIDKYGVDHSVSDMSGEE